MTNEIIFYTNPMSRDVYCGSHSGMGLRFGSMENRPAFAEYWQRVSDRDAYRRATALDDALMPT